MLTSRAKTNEEFRAEVLAVIEKSYIQYDYVILHGRTKRDREFASGKKGVLLLLHMQLSNLVFM